MSYRLVAELADEGATHEAIEICINAGWHGLAADLLTGEAEQLLASGRYAALARWLYRLPADETRSHPALASLARELQPAPRPEDRTEPGQRSSLTPVPPSPPQRHWSFRRPRHSPASTVKPPLLPESAGLPATGTQDAVAVVTGQASARLGVTARTSTAALGSSPPQEDHGAPAHPPARPGHATPMAGRLRST